ncbi:MAG: hypothetical protein M3335_01030 [Actinomycetota bacterium]|nr:hypothetical protein [Actinomycetota bacterium]
MSCIVYGALTAQREAAPKGTSKDSEAPGFGSYVDVVAALVPAEILAANAVLLPLMAETKADSTGQAVTTVHDPSNLELVFWLSIAFSIALYVIGDRARARIAARKSEEVAGSGQRVGVISWDAWNTLRALIPAGAYVAWTMLQKSTAFDAVSPDMAEAQRMVIAVFGAIALGAIAKALSDKADNQAPPEPTSVSGAGGTSES